MIKFIKTRDVKSPSRGTTESAGLDFYIPNDYSGDSFLGPGKSTNIPSGIKMVIPKGYAGIFFNKSGVAIKGLQVGACVIDSDYRGEVHLNVHNISHEHVYLEPGQKLVQMIIQQVVLTEATMISEETFQSYANTERGTGGFGSTGK